jgi:predicted glycosyltransferase
MDKKAIWVDLDNSPHVPLFVPIIRHYRSQGVEVIVTARDHSQTRELLELHGLAGTYRVIGSHYGKSKFHKMRGALVRAFQLVSYIRQQKQRVAVAVSHGSRSMAIAARLLQAPVLTMYDYEFTETAIFNRLSAVVLIPESLPDEVLDEIGLSSRKRRKYPGIKEELYIRAFRPTPNFRERFLKEHGADVEDGRILAVVRPPATTANYHSKNSEVLLDDILQFLLSARDVLTVIVPRTIEQAGEIRQRATRLPNADGQCIVLDEAVDGLELAAASDLVISGGGTMNREAALLGVPVYSIFAGRQGALDRQMEADGRITFIRDARDLSKVRLQRRKPVQPPALTDRVEQFVIQEIDKFL